MFPTQMSCEPIGENLVHSNPVAAKRWKRMTERIPSTWQYKQLTDWSLLCFMVARSCAHVCEVNFADFAQRTFPLRGPLRGTVSPKSLLEAWGPFLVPLPLPSMRRALIFFSTLFLRNPRKTQNKATIFPSLKLTQGTPKKQSKTGEFEEDQKGIHKRGIHEKAKFTLFEDILYSTL